MRTVPVLLYHAVDVVPRDGFETWTTSAAAFAEHIDVIAASGRLPLTISELGEILRRNRPLDRAAVAVTFDDGYACTKGAVLQLLQRDISSTVYVTTGTIGNAGMLSGAQLEDLDRLEGVELGAHSITHPRLDELDGAQLDEEVTGSKRDLEALVAGPVASFAYPHGSHDRRTIEAVVRAGYRSAAAVKNAMSHLDDDPFAIARWTVTAGTTSDDLDRVLRGEGVPLSWKGERARTRAYRTARRARRWLDARAGAVSR